MKPTLSILCVFFIGGSQALFAQTMSVVADLYEAGGANSVGPIAFEFYEREVKTKNYPIFDSNTLTSDEAGQVFTATQANDPDFGPLATLLTDGADEDVGFAILFDGFPAIGQNAPESVFFANLPDDNPNGFGLAGYQIDSISVVFNQLSVNSPGSNPNGDGIWTDVSFIGELSINYETVPEPATTVLLATLGLTFALWGRNRVRKTGRYFSKY